MRGCDATRRSLFVLDVSRSMAASATSDSPTRLDRAVDAPPSGCASPIPGVSAGVATLTDRVLPDLLPGRRPGGLRRASLAREASRSRARRRRRRAVRATSYDALARDPRRRLLRPARALPHRRRADRRREHAGADGRRSPPRSRRTPGYHVLVRPVLARERGDLRRRRPRRVGLPPRPGRRRRRSSALASALGGSAYDEARARRRAQRLQQLVGPRPDDASAGDRADADAARSLRRRRSHCSRRSASIALPLGLACARTMDAAVERQASRVHRGRRPARRRRGVHAADLGVGPHLRRRERRLARLRQHAGREPPLAADADHDGATSSSSAGSSPSTSARSTRAIRRGQQSYPGRVERHAVRDDERRQRLRRSTRRPAPSSGAGQPDNVAVFRNFGIVANRGVALCDGHVFVLTLDMTIVSLDPATGKLERRVPIAKAVPGASSSYGYSETSAPICAQPPADRRRRRLGVRRARLRDGVPHRPHAGLAEPVLDDPAGGHRAGGSTARSSAAASSGRRRRSTRRRTRSTSAPARRRRSTSRRSGPGSNPRADSLVAVDLASGRLKWWQQQMAHNEWSYDTAQPPMVYTGNDRRQEARASSRSRRWKASGSRTTPRPAGRSTSA